MKRRLLLFLAALLCFPISSMAQSSLVAQKKSELHITVNPTPEQLNQLVRAVAGAVHGGILPKTSGSNCLGYSCDIVCANGRAIDILGDSEGAASPQWNDVGPISGCEAVTVTPPPPPPGDILPTEILERLTHLEARVTALESGGGGTVPPDNDTLKAILEVDKQILELLQKTATRFGIK